MKFVATINCGYRTERGQFVTFTVGTEIAAAKYNALPASMQRHFVTKRKYNQRQDRSVKMHNHLDALLTSVRN